MPFSSKHFLPQAGFALALLSSFALATPGHAQNLYQTGFESPGFTTGPINGQDGWTARPILPTDNNSQGAAPSGVVSTSAPASGNHSLQINNSTLDYLPNDGLYEGVYQPNVSFTATAQSIFLIQAAVRVDGPNSGADLSSANLVVYNSSNYDLGEIYASSSGNIYGDNGPDYFNAAPPSYTLGQYATLGLKLDFTDLTESYYVNGSFIDSLPMVSGSLADPTFSVNLDGIGSADDQYGLDSGGYKITHSSYTDYFDDLSVAAVPEASSVVSLGLLLALGLGGLVIAAKRKKAIGETSCLKSSLNQ